MTSRLKHGNIIKNQGRKEKILENIKVQLKDVDLWRATAAEFLATFIFLFIVCITHMLPTINKDNVLANGLANESVPGLIFGEPLQVSVGIALTYSTLIQCFEHISGGHMNPAISFAMFIAGHVTALKAALYTLAQLTGAFSAVALCYGMIPDKLEQLNAISKLNDNLTSLQGFGVELLQTMIVTITWLATYATSKTHLGSSALPVGIAFLANSLWAGQLTGSSMNPARSLPPAVLSRYWSGLWVFIAGPFIGSFCGAMMYTQVFITTPKKQNVRNVTESGRSAEGESVQSDQDATEIIPLNQLVQHKVTSTMQSENVHNPEREKVFMTQGSNHHRALQYSNSRTRQIQPLLLSHQQKTYASIIAPVISQQNTSQNSLVPHQSLIAPARKLTNAKLRTLHYDESKGNVDTRFYSKTPSSRPHTACGPLLVSSPRTNAGTDTLVRSRSQAATPATNFRTLSLSEPFSVSSDALINNSIL